MIKLPASPRDSPSLRSPGGSAGIRSPRHQMKRNARRINHSSNLGRKSNSKSNIFDFSIPEESEVVVVSQPCESAEGRDEADTPRKRKDENSNSNIIINNNEAETPLRSEIKADSSSSNNNNNNMIMQMNNLMINCTVELPSDGTRLALQPEPIATPKSTTKTVEEDVEPTTSEPNTVPRTKSKKVLVIDPGSGKKCQLTRDDHSLTDKELHVYHQQKRSQRWKQRRAHKGNSSDDSDVDEEEKTAATFQTNATGHTMVSALTEVSYVRNKWDMLPLSPILFGRNAVEEKRDDEEVVEVGHYKQLLMDMRDPALMPDHYYNDRFSWLGCLSPRGQMAERDFGPVPYRRITMVIFPNELHDCIEEEDETLMGMKLVQNVDDFQAHVSDVLRGSKAYRLGVRKGDVLSFAVALSNVSKDDGAMADKIIKRLESVGMRTSYRELYDIFLSKSTNSRPIGLVFRRCLRNPAAPITFNSNRINDEFEWSTGFVQALTIKCREYEFEQKVPFHNNESFDSDILPFVSSPNVSLGADSLVLNYFSVVGNITDYFCSDVETAEDNFLSYRTLRSLVEQSVALAFVCQGNKPQNGSKKATGNGFVVVRSDDGSWSPPCFLSMMGNGSNEDRSFKNANMIVISSKNILEQLMSGSVVHFNAPKNEIRDTDALALDSVMLGLEGGVFLPVQGISVAVKTSESQNQGAYVSSFGQRVRNENIVDGQVLPPEQSVDFYGALQSLELPHSMHAHPVVPDKIEPYCNNDWTELNQYLSPRNGGMMSVLKYCSPEDRYEIDIFTRRLKYYLMDGVPVQMVSSFTFDDEEERELRLTIANPYSLNGSQLELAKKRKAGMSDRQRNFSTSFDCITKLSRQPPPSLKLDEEDKRRFFLLETDLSSGPIMMLTKSKRDGELLLAGLKLLLEKDRMLQ